MESFPPPDAGAATPDLSDDDDDDVPDLMPIGEEAVGSGGRVLPPTTGEAIPQSQKVPVTILTGFLGSGKTTLLNHILLGDHGMRIAVVENEFGDSAGIESLIAKDGVSGDTLDGIFELRNGCVCCSVKDDMVSTLETLVRTRGGRFDAIVIETTGLANPGPVASVFWLDDALESALALDAIVTVVDSYNIRRHLRDDAGGAEGHADQAREQIAFADRVLLNKADLLDDGAMAAVEDAVRAINDSASTRRSVRGRVPLEWVLRTRCFGRNAAAELGRALGVAPAPARARPGALWSSAAGGEAPREPPSAVSTVAVDAAGLVRIGDLRRFLGDVLWDRAEGEGDGGGGTEMDIYRVKGAFWSIDALVEDEEDLDGPARLEAPALYVVQGVYDLFDLSRVKTEGSLGDLPPWIRSPGTNRVVFIGRRLHGAELKRRFDACVAPPAEEALSMNT